MKIEAAVAWEPGAPLRIEEVELDEPRQNEILVRVEAAGVCQTDEHARHRRLPVELPMILGHEGAGVVERVGSAVTRVEPGDRVLMTTDYCGDCPACRLGRTPYCDNVFGVIFAGTRPDGSPRAWRGDTPIRAAFFGQSSFATHALVTERNIVPVPADAPLRYLAGLTCGVPTGAGAVLSALPVGPGRSFAVFGAGAVGLGALMAAVASGADEVVAVDRVPARLELATELGATHVIDTTGQDLADVAAEVRKVTRGGAASALDTTGVPDVVGAAVDSLATFGTCGIVSGGRDLTLRASALLSRGRALRGVMGGDIAPTVLLPRLLDLHARGRFPIDRLVRAYPFTEVNTAMADSLTGETVKPVLTFG
jgi:aryl-alcohol dehydrogenase